MVKGYNVVVRGLGVKTRERIAYDIKDVVSDLWDFGCNMINDNLIKSITDLEPEQTNIIYNSNDYKEFTIHCFNRGF